MKKLWLLLTLAVLAGSCQNNCQPITIPAPKEKLFLAFAEANSSNMRVRWSDDRGVTWQDGNFPAQPTTTSFQGIGAAADEAGVLHIVMTDAANDINFVWGLGPAIWDNSARSQATHPPVSAPSAANIGDGRWIVAFRRGDGTVTASVYDTGARAFVIPDVAPPSPLNSNVDGRPAVTVMGGNIVLVWRRWAGGGLFSLITAVGQVVSGVPTFSQPSEVPLPATSAHRAGIQSDPDVTHDYNQFYTAFVREEQGGTLHGWDVVVFSSPDGTTWQEHSIVVSLSVVASSDAVTRKTFVNIAGQSDGTLMAAAVSGSPNSGGVTAAKLNPASGQWGGLSDQEVQNMFGSNNAFPKQFALIGTGRP